MTLIPDSFASGFALVASALVGAAFIWTGVIKATAPHTFWRHLSSFGWIPDKYLAASVTFAAAFEAGWGAALFLRLTPQFLFPLSILGLAILSTISWWGVRSGKASDCGCYGGVIQPSIGQSLGLNAVFASLIVASWLIKPRGAGLVSWQLVVVVAAAAVVALLTYYAQRFEKKNGTPKFTPSPLKVGAKWRDAWAHGATRGVEGEILVSFLGPDCPYCKQWVKVGNAIVQGHGLPKIVGVVGVPSSRRNEFMEEHGVRFPIETVSGSLMSRLAQAVPTTVMVESGMIKEIWVGSMPAEFAGRFRRAFFPDAPREETRKDVPSVVNAPVG